MTKFVKYSSVGIAFILAGAVALLFWQNSNLKTEKTALKWEITTTKAKIDTVKIPGVYSTPDTVLVTDTLTFTDTLSGKTHIAYRDRPVIKGDIFFDTTKVFGEDHNPLSVTVSGKIHYPAEFSHQNWLLIVPEFSKPPIIASKRRSPKSWGIGLAGIISSSGANGIGGAWRYNRTSMAVYRQVNQNTWTLGLNYEILSF